MLHGRGDLRPYQGHHPCPEPSHALDSAIREANRCKDSGESRVILVALCGHGHFDMAAYEAFFAGRLKDFDYPQEKARTALDHLPAVPA